MIFRAWVRIWFILVILAISCSVLFVYVIDPHGENSSFQYHGINISKIIQDERVSKFNYLKNNNDYEAVILGNSKAAYIDPDIITKYTGFEAYNASFSSGTMDEFLIFSKWLTNNRNIKQIFIIFDYYSVTEFKSNGTMPPALETRKTDVVRYLSLSKFGDSIKTLIHNASSKVIIGNVENEYLKKGMRYDKNYFNRLKSREQQLRHAAELELREPPAWVALDIKEERINNLKNLVELCDEKGIDLFLIQAPSSYKVFKDKDNYNKLLSLITRIAQEIHPVYLFNTFNYVNNDLKYFLDHDHFNYEVSELIFKRVFLNSSIGLKITSDNLESMDRLKNVDEVNITD